MINKDMNNYVEWNVKGVMHINDAYGFRVILKYGDGSIKQQQQSGFGTKKEAERKREETIALLHNGTYIVNRDVKVSELFEYWVEEELAVKVNSFSTYDTYKRIYNNHILPELGNKKMDEVGRGDVQKLYYRKKELSKSTLNLIKTVLCAAFSYAVEIKVASVNVAEGVSIPKDKTNNETSGYHNRVIDTRKTLTLDQIMLLIEKSRETKIHMMLLFNVLMGLRRSEIIAVKYSDVDFLNKELRLHTQLGRMIGVKKEDLPPKTYTKQEIPMKTRSSERILPIPDYVMEAIIEQRGIYERNRSRRSTAFQDDDYICCSSYGRPRCSTYHSKHYKKLLKDCGLPDIRWHDLRSTYCTLLIKNDFSPKAVSKLMGHSKEIITLDVYADNKNIINDATPELQAFIDEVAPQEEDYELEDIVIDVTPYLP